MCLLIHQPEGVRFSEEDFRNFFQRNSDGFGFMWGDGQRLHITKLVIEKVGDIVKAYEALIPEKNAVLHFRMATHGPKTKQNVHPFRVTAEIGMAHNGILSSSNPFDKERTDSEHLIEYFIRPIAKVSPDLIFDARWGEMLASLIGASNRLVFMHADGRIAIINEKQGVRYKEAWMSNTYAWNQPGRSPSYVPQWHGRGGHWPDNEDDHNPYRVAPEPSVHDRGLVSVKSGVTIVPAPVAQPSAVEKTEHEKDEEERQIALKISKNLASATEEQLNALAFKYLRTFADTLKQGGDTALLQQIRGFKHMASLVISQYYTKTYLEARKLVYSSEADSADCIMDLIATQLVANDG